MESASAAAPVKFSVAVFPYLKTLAPVTIGKYRFRSTDDTDGLPAPVACAVRDIADMLFVKDDLRVTSASYAVVSWIKQDSPGSELERLIQLRAIVAYLYSHPHDSFDSVLLTPEDCSLIVLSPDRVSKFLVRPEHHTTQVGNAEKQAADQQHSLGGYSGFFNLSQPLWVEVGSRIYPPVPQITLNIAQNLASDMQQLALSEECGISVLDLLGAQDDPALGHIFTALHWYNFANERAAGADRALLSLAIAFEALLMLPQDAKTERFVDAVSLLLGRTERIDLWARQFYNVRSSVAHEGRGRDLHYYPEARGGKVGRLDGRAAPLVFYGRHIFRLCVSTALTGAILARRADIRQKLTTHPERLAAVCEKLSAAGSAREKLATVREDVSALSRYMYLASGQFKLSEMLGAGRVFARAMLELDERLEPEVRKLIEECALPKGGKSDLEQVQALRSLHEALRRINRAGFSEEFWLLDDFVHFVWTNTLFFGLDVQNPEVPPGD